MRWLRPLRPNESAAQEAGQKDGGLLRFILLLALLAWAVRSFLVAPFSIPSGSMLPTLFVGDYLLVAKWPYGYSRNSFPWGFPSFKGRIFADLPERGDVVVFRHPRADLDLIKRVIAVPGDTVAMRGGMVILNGVPLRRQALAPFASPISPNSPCRVAPPATARVIDGPDGPLCLYPLYRETLPGGVSYGVIDQVENPVADNFGPVRIPRGHVFLMGDNRDDSLDSRFAVEAGGVGLLPVDKLIGRALFTFWSTDGSASYVKPWTWFSALRSERIGNPYQRKGE